MANVLTQRQANQVLRTQVRELLTRSASFRALPFAQRKTTLARMVAATKFLANGNGLTSQFALRLTEARDGTTQAASVISQVDFPGFVAGLLHGVFNAIVASSIEQMEAYSALVGAVANDVEPFMRDNEERSDEYLVHHWPDWFSKQSGQVLAFIAQQKSVALSEVLSTIAPELDIARPTLAKARKATRQTRAIAQQQIVLSEIDQAFQRIAPSDRRLALERLPITFPQVFIEETSPTLAPIQGISSSTAGFVGLTARNVWGEAVSLVTSWSEFERNFGGIFEPSPEQTGHQFLPNAVQGFFANGGTRAYIAPIRVSDGEAITDLNYIGSTEPPSALAALAQVNEISMLLAPGVSSLAVQRAMVAQCELRRDRLCLLDMPLEFPQPWTALPIDSNFAAAYWPWLSITTDFGDIAIPPSGHVAGQYARLPAHRAPRADAIVGASGLSRSISDGDQSLLNELRINSLRSFGGRPGPMVWGLRSISSDPEWRYLFARRYAIYLKQSIANGLHWVTFEANTSTLWRSVTAQVENFLHSEWRNGALIGPKSEQVLFVKCDRSTMTQADIDNGRLVVMIGYAMFKPAEFTLIQIEQKTVS